MLADDLQHPLEPFILRFCYCVVLSLCVKLFPPQSGPLVRFVALLLFFDCIFIRNE